MREKFFMFGLAALIVMAMAIPTGAGQTMGQSHGSQGHGHDQAAKPQANMMAATDQMMRNIDSMMTNAGSAMRDLTAMHAGMSGGAEHGPMLASMESLLAQMRQFRGDLHDMAKNPMLAHNNDAMKSYQQACRNLEQMASAFQSMTKNMTSALKGMSHATK